MSGSLSAISSVVGKASSVFNAVSTLFGGSGSIRLGSVTFAGLEVPENISWGGKQRIVTQVLPGGKVIMFAMGVEFPPLTWGGVFEGMFALSRSRQLYTMLHTSDNVSLSWNDRSYTVRVAEYEAIDTKTNWIPYKISLVVLRDETISAKPSAPSLLSRITGDIASAVGVTPAALVAGVGTALTVAQTAATVVGAVTGGSGALGALSGAIGVAQGAVGGAMAVANSGLAGIVSGAITTGSLVIPAGSAAAGIISLGSSLAHAANLAALPIIGGLLGRTQTNLRDAGT